MENDRENSLEVGRRGRTGLNSHSPSSIGGTAPQTWLSWTEACSLPSRAPWLVSVLSLEC